MTKELKKIFIIGNAAGGKTYLAEHLAKQFTLPLTSVDSIQFLPGMKIRELNETRKILLEIEKKDTWIIDGFGPLDLIHNRFVQADKIIYIDLPLWQHYLWFLKRQIKSLWAPRHELPEGCSEISWGHTLKVIRSMWSMHKQMRPELFKILNREPLKSKTSVIRSKKQLNQIALAQGHD